MLYPFFTWNSFKIQIHFYISNLNLILHYFYIECMCMCVHMVWLNSSISIYWIKCTYGKCQCRLLWERLKWLCEHTVVQTRTWNLLCTSALISSALAIEMPYLEKHLTRVLQSHNADIRINLSSLNSVALWHDTIKMHMSEISDQLILRIYGLPTDSVWA